MTPVIKKILFATDLSETAKHAFGYAVSLADKYNCELIIVHVIKGDSPYVAEGLRLALGEELYNEIVQKKSENARNVLIHKKTEAHYISKAIQNLSQEAAEGLNRSEIFKVKDLVLEADSISQKIIKVAQDEGCDMLVLGHRKRHLLSEGVGEGTLKKLLRVGSIPVLVVPPPPK